MALQIFSRLAGTLHHAFRIGSALLKTDAGALVVRNAADTALLPVEAAGLKVPTNAVNGYVWTSDANGNGSWQPAPSGAGGEGSGLRMSMLTIEGELQPLSNPLRIYNATGVAIPITSVFIAVSTPPVGAPIIVDVNLDGVTIFTDQSHRPQIADGFNTGETTLIDVPTWPAGSYLTIDVDQVGSTTPGKDLVVHILYGVFTGSIDADTLDGMDSTAFALADHTHDYASADHTHNYAPAEHTHALGDLSNIDLATTPPVDGNALVYDGTLQAWVPGNGASEEYFDPQAPPASPSAIDDEFNGSISESWSWNAEPASVDLVSHAGWLLVELASAAAYELRRPFVPSVAEFGIETMLSFPGSIDGDSMGIAVLDADNNHIADFSVDIFNGGHVFRSTAPNQPNFQPVGEDLCINGSVENDIGSEWTLSGVERAAHDAYSGAYHLRGTNLAPTTTPWSRYARQVFTVTKPGIYVLSCWMRGSIIGSGAVYSRARMRLVNPLGVVIYTSPEVDSTSWINVKTTISIDESQLGDYTFWFSPYSTRTGIDWGASRAACDLVQFYLEDTIPAPFGNLIWLRIHRDINNVYRFWWSTDGVTWKLIYTSYANGTEVAQLALLFRQSVAINRHYGVNYVRRYI